MKTKLLFIVILICGAFAIVSCNTNNISSSDLTVGIDGPNSIKGTFTGTMIDSSKSFTFNYDFHVTTNDEYSYSEGLIDGVTGDSILYVSQYFYFDRNGYDDDGDRTSASGQYLNLGLTAKISIKKNVMTLTQVNNGIAPPCDCGYLYNSLSGMWQNVNSNGSRFVYGSMYYYGYQSYNVQPTYQITNLAYDNSSQTLSGKMNFAVATNNDLSVESNNYNATTITGDFKIYVPKANLQVFNTKTGNGGNVYRKRAH